MVPQHLDDADATTDPLQVSVVRALRTIRTKAFSDDYAIEAVMKKTDINRDEAKTWLKRLKESGLLAIDPEGHLRLVR